MADSSALDEVTLLKGERVTLKEMKTIVVLEFWATWCGPCRAVTPHMTEIQKKYKGKVNIVGITNEEPDVAKRFVDSAGDKMDYTVVADPEGHTQEWQRKLKIKGIPHAAILDQKLNVVWAGHPMMPQFEEELQKAIATLAPAIDFKGKSKEDLSALPVKDLKAALQAKHVDTTGLTEKSEFVDAVFKAYN